MAEYSTFLNRLRHDLGKRFTVAEEHTADPQTVNLLVLRQRHDALLTVAADARWLALHGHADGDTPTLRVEYKHLVVAVRNYFARPEALPPATFRWPGTQGSREELRRALSRRRRRA